MNLQTSFLRQCNILRDGGFLTHPLLLDCSVSLFCFQCLALINNAVVYVFLREAFFIIRIISVVIELQY